MTKRVFLGFILLTSVAAAALFGGRVFLLHAQTGDTDTLLRANQQYENGRYDEAAALYQQLVDSGIENSTLFYNLGNAYFKAGDIGRAILNYERASRLSPRDDDIRTNLELARKQAVDKYETEEVPALARLVEVARSWLTLNETAVVTLVLWLALGTLFLFHRHARSSRLRESLTYAQILCALLLIGGIFSLGSRLYLESTAPQAIILVPEVDVVSGPGDQYITEFTLHSGAEVSFLDQRNGWVRVALPGNQFQGWVPMGTVMAVAGGEELGQ